MKTGEIWVVQSGKWWFVTQPDRSGRLGEFDNEQSALERGREFAAFTGSDLLIKTKTGWVRERRVRSRDGAVVKKH